MQNRGSAKGSEGKNTSKRTNNAAQQGRNRRLDVAYSSDESDCDDSSGSDHDENYVSTSTANVTEQLGIQTKDSSRPARSAATKATEALAPGHQTSDYLREPELLYERQVIRYAM